MAQNMYPHKPEDWEEQRPRIKKLYLEDRRTLKDVMAIMKEQYGFKAT